MFFVGQAVRLQKSEEELFSRGIARMHQNGGLVPGARKTELVGFKIKHHVEHADKHILGKVTAQSGVQRTEHAGWIVDVRSVDAQYAAADRHHQSAAYPFSADIGNGQTDMLVIDLDEVVIVAANLQSGMVEGCEFDGRVVRELLRKQRVLDLLGNLHIAVELPLVFERLLQSGIVDRDGGLRRESLGKIEVRRGKARAIGTVDQGHDPNGMVSKSHGYNQHGSDL